MKKRYKITLAIVSLCIAMLAVGGYVYANREKPVEKPPEQPRVEVKPFALDTNKIFILVNAERQKVGLTPLVRDPRLDKSSTEKCQDMAAKDYFSHVSPDGVSWNYFVYNNVPKAHAGENIAKDYFTEESLVKGWMNSPSHREAILMTTWENVGYGFCKNGVDNYTVQHFYDYK